MSKKKKNSYAFRLEFFIGDDIDQTESMNYSCNGIDFQEGAKKLLASVRQLVADDKRIICQEKKK